MPTVTSSNREEFIQKELDRREGKSRHPLYARAAELAHELSGKAELHHDEHHHDRAHIAHEMAHEFSKPDRELMKHHKEKMSHHHKMREEAKEGIKEMI